MAIVSISFSSELLSEPKGKSSAAPGIKLKLNFPTSVRHIYQMSDTTVVYRTYSDSSTKKYTREYEFSMTERQLSDPEKGFYKIDVSIDSLNYRFKDGEAVYDFNSQADNPGALTFEDLVVNSVPLGKDFEMTYSPYGEVIKIEGERLDWLKNYIEEEGKGLPDTVLKFFWLDGISLNHLKYVADTKKLIYPVYQVNVDSSWKSPFDFMINGMYYSDTAYAKITKIGDGEIHIQSKLNNIRALDKYGKFYNIKGQLLQIVKSQGTGYYNLVLSSKGTIKKAELVTNVDITVKVNRDVFTERISSKVVWDLLKQLHFK